MAKTPKTEQSRATSIALWIAGLAVLLLVVFLVRRLTRQSVVVRTAAATYQTISATVSTNGKVEPIDEFQAHAPQPGVIQQIYVQLGQHVQVGTLLLRMDDADARKQLAAAQASVASAQATLTDLDQGGSTEERSRFKTDIASARADQQQAQNTLDSDISLQQKGAVSAGEVAVAKQKLDATKTALANAQARTSGRYSGGDRASAQARLAEAQASVAAARTALAEVDIRSPLAGSVYAIPYSQYDFVPSGNDDLLDVADLTQIQVRAYFDEPDIGKLAAGQLVKIVWDAKPGITWHGHVMRAPTTVTSYHETRSVGESLISVDDAHGDLLPNTNVTVTVTETRRDNVLTVPREALRDDMAGNFVYRIVGGRLIRTPVQVGVVNLTSVEITGGLSANEQVVLGPAISGQDLLNGLEVSPSSKP